MRNPGMQCFKFMMQLGLLCTASTMALPAQTITTFEVAGSGTGGAEGTLVSNINTAGTMVGAYIDAGGVSHPYLRTSDGVDTAFVVPNSGTGKGEGSGAIAINTGGVVAGSYQDSASVNHGFVRATDGTITEFNAPGAGTGKGQGTVPRAINTGGTIAGYYIDAGGVYHGFVRSAAGKITAFSAKGAGTGNGQGTYVDPLFSSGPKINAAGTIVGYYIDAGGVLHAYVRAANGNIAEFDAPGAGTLASEGTIASGINAAGTIVGRYADSGKIVRGFIRGQPHVHRV